MTLTRKTVTSFNWVLVAVIVLDAVLFIWGLQLLGETAGHGHGHDQHHLEDLIEPALQGKLLIALALLVA